MNYKVAIVDDHALVRSGLVKLINSFESFEVILQAENGSDFLEKLLFGELPDIAVVDLNMPIMNGYDTIQALKEKYSKIMSLALTVDLTNEALIKSERCGSRGILRKNATAKDFEFALNSLVQSGCYQTFESKRLLKDNPDLLTKSEKKVEEELRKLTPRELEFLILLTNNPDLAFKEIAPMMDISLRGLEHHKSRLFEKLEVRSKSGLINKGFELNLKNMDLK